jgi:hypothetical protein
VAENKTHAPEGSVSWFSRDGATAAMGPSVVARRQNRSERRRPREKQQRELPDWWMDGWTNIVDSWMQSAGQNIWIWMINNATS